MLRGAWAGSVFAWNKAAAKDPAKAADFNERAIDAAYAAFMDDNEYLTALNNYIWYATHTLDGENIKDLATVGPREATHIETLLDFFVRDQQLIDSRYAELIETAAAGYAALSRRSDCPMAAQAARRLAGRLEEVAELFNSDEELLNYRQSAARIRAFVPATSGVKAAAR